MSFLSPPPAKTESNKGVEKYFKPLEDDKDIMVCQIEKKLGEDEKVVCGVKIKITGSGEKNKGKVT